jgi:hypothetical protein
MEVNMSEIIEDQKILSIQEDSKNCEECFHNSRTCEYVPHGLLGTTLLPRDKEGNCKSLKKEVKEKK